MDTLGVFPLGIKDHLLLKMVTVDIDVLVFVGPSIEDSHSIFYGEIDLEIAPKIDNLSDSVDDDILFGL
jgi:hypothetical protein